MSYCEGYPIPTFCSLFKNPCNISERQLEEDANSRIHNPVYFNGITKHGYQRPIMEAVNPACRDPIVGKPQLNEFLPNPEDQNYGKQAEKFRFLDIYSGLVDGINYGKLHRLIAHKKRHARAPYGSHEKFCIPVATNMNYGWWIRDLKCLDRTNWYKPKQRFPQKRSEMTIFVDEMGKTTPNFILF